MYALFICTLISNSLYWCFLFSTRMKPKNNKARSRPLQHKFVATAIQDQFFIRSSRNGKAIGNLYPEVFDPISVKLIGLIYALVSFPWCKNLLLTSYTQARSCLDEWKEGYEVRANFNVAVYIVEYENILKEIAVFQKHPATRPLIEKIQQRLFDNSV